MEISGGDSMIVKASGAQRKIFLASIRPPRQSQPVDSENADDPRKKIRERSLVFYSCRVSRVLRSLWLTGVCLCVTQD